MELLVLNSEFESVGIIDEFESLIWVDRYYSCGDFELYLPANTNNLYFLRQNNYLWLKESEHCMIIETISIETDVEDGDHLKVTGQSLEILLNRRIVWGQKVLKGNLQEGIRTLLNEAIISPTIADRKIENFIFEESTDPKITALTIDTQFTGDNLYDVICTLCYEHDLGFKIILNENNQFVFSLYSGVDRSYSQEENSYVVFSPNFENLINTNYYMTDVDFKNVTLVGGEGEGAARKTTTVGEASGLDRREIFTDARHVSSYIDGGTMSNTEYISQLQAEGIVNLIEHDTYEAFEGVAETSLTYKYGEDFFMGDIVQIADKYGNEGASRITELIISQDGEGVSTYPTFEMIY